MIGMSEFFTGVNVDELLDTAMRFASHRKGCQQISGNKGGCTCGLDKLTTEVGEYRAKVKRITVIKWDEHEPVTHLGPKLRKCPKCGVTLGLGTTNHGDVCKGRKRLAPSTGERK